jgi:predicted nucleic acid-binding protein
VALPVTGKVLLDNNVFIDYLRTDRYADWIFGGVSNIIRFLSSVVLMELRIGADTLRRQRVVDRIQAAFPASRLIAPLPLLFDQAGQLFRTLHGNGSGLDDRLGPVNDLLIALTARQIGATVLTSNVEDFQRVARHLPGLRIVAPV